VFVLKKPLLGGLLICILAAILVANIHYEVVPIRFFYGSNNGLNFRVLSFNVHSEAEGFISSSQKIAKMIMEEKPDFVFLTEYYEGTDETLQIVLEQHYPYMDRKYRWGTNEGDAFYSQWQIDSVSRIKLPNHFSAIYRAQIHKGIDTLTMFCCHLSSNNMKLENGKLASLREGRILRSIEADTLAMVLRREKYPVIVMGDMNDVAGSSPVKKIKSVGLTDAWWKGGCGYGSTYHDGWIKLRIDYVFYDDQQLKLKTVDVVGEKEWSDHRAIVARFDLENNI